MNFDEYHAYENTKLIEKIEPKSRKTDGFMAFVAAFIVSDRLEPYQQQRPRNLGVYTYG